MTERAKKLVAALPAGFEAAYIGTAVNRFYLLDFDAHDAGHLVVLPDELVYIIDSRYIEVARRAVTGARVVLEEDALAQVAEVLKQAGVRTLH
ncbi:aminopeptidase P family N-terminal domain-containing protein, partial [Ruminococcaceae bacterium OttesenSCG-928-A11]|nr:aminopeptidase P family N-terminal domain-containing protein [Ruminococcaceae bacterium OttesenSCG-928-A11]